MRADEKTGARMVATGLSHADAGTIGRHALHDATRAEAASAWPAGYRVAVAIPCFQVRAHILGVLARIGREVRASTWSTTPAPNSPANSSSSTAPTRACACCATRRTRASAAPS